MLIATSFAPAQDQNSGDQWISFNSKEKGPAPKLEVVDVKGNTKSIPVAADTTVISYLADQSWGHLPWLAIDLGGRNQMIVQFDEPIPDDIRSVTLVMSMAIHNSMPRRPFEITLHNVEEKWTETAVTWKKRPKSAESPTLKVMVDPKAKECRIDLSKLFAKGTPRPKGSYGWLMKVATPLAVAVAGNNDEVDAANNALIKLLGFQASPNKALKLAQEKNKRVLAVVGAGFGNESLTMSEALLLAIGLAEPEVIDLVKSEFIPVRVAYSPIQHIMDARNVKDDPLRVLGASVSTIKAPALLVCSPEGKLIASMSSIGTYDCSLMHQFLIEAAGHKNQESAVGDGWQLFRSGRLRAAEKIFTAAKSVDGSLGLASIALAKGEFSRAAELASPFVKAAGESQQDAEVIAATALLRLGKNGEAEQLLNHAVSTGKSKRLDQAKYLLAVCKERIGNRSDAAKMVKQLAEQGTSEAIVAKAKVRLAHWHAISQNEYSQHLIGNASLSQTEYDGRKSEDRIVREAIEYLLRQQWPNGSWNAADPGMYGVAVTSLVARSLLGWSKQTDQVTGERLRQACDRATRWLNKQIGTADPERFESFGAAYLVEYFLDLEAEKMTVRGDTKRAISVLLGGQCPHGGWSYNRNFAINWRGGFGGWPKTDKGREHSMNTGPAMLALTRAKQMGFPINEKNLEAGKQSLLAMRDSAGVFTYTYPEPRCFNKPDSSIGRASACELALFRLGSSRKEDIESTIGLFFKYRKGLRIPVKLTESWLPPLGVSNYFYFYAYHHAARAIAEHGVKTRERLEQLRDDLLSVVEADSTWIDFPQIGKPYATAMALDVIRLARSPNPN